MDRMIRCKKQKDIPANFTGIVVFPSGVKHYYRNGKLHREDGPAIDYSEKGPDAEVKGFWYLNGLRHRTDGPAAVGTSKHDSKEWFLHGKMMSAEQHFESLTDEEKAVAIWKINEWVDQ